MTATLSCCFVITSSCGGTISITVRFQTQETTKLITLRLLVVSFLHLGPQPRGFWVIKPIEPFVLKSNYYLNMKVNDKFYWLRELMVMLR